VVPFARSALAFASLPLLSGFRSLLPVRGTRTCPDSALLHLGFCLSQCTPRRGRLLVARTVLSRRTFPPPYDVPFDAPSWWPVFASRIDFRSSRIAVYFSFLEPSPVQRSRIRDRTNPLRRFAAPSPQKSVPLRARASVRQSPKVLDIFFPLVSFWFGELPSPRWIDTFFRSSSTLRPSVHEISFVLRKWARHFLAGLARMLLRFLSESTAASLSFRSASPSGRALEWRTHPAR
jgi:hypothetical protein